MALGALTTDVDSGGSGTGLLDPPPRGSRRPTPPPGGHDDGDGGDDDGGGGGGGGEPGPREEPDPGAAELAVRLVLVAVTALFLVLLAMLWRARGAAETWPPADLPPPPALLWASTALIALSSTALTRAAWHAGRRPKHARRWLGATLGLGVAFLACQGLAGARWIEAGVLPERGAYAASFYVLAGLHAAHVLGGLAYLAHLFRGRSARPAALRLAGTYWHFMGLVWVCVFALLWWPVGGAAG